MADKKYYWLKLKDDFFTQPKVKKLRRIAGGDTYTIIYLKMQLLSLKNEGVIVYESIEPTFTEELALKIDEDVENIQVTLTYLVAQGLLIENEDYNFALLETMENIGSETQGAERVRRFRSNKNEQKALQCNGGVTKCNTEIEIEKEIERREKRKDIEIEKKATKVARFGIEELDKAFDDYLAMRKKKRAVPTERAIQLVINKLTKLAKNTFDDSIDTEKAIKILEASIVNNWTDVYPLKENQSKGQIDWENV